MYKYNKALLGNVIVTFSFCYAVPVVTVQKLSVKKLPLQRRFAKTKAKFCRISQTEN